MNTDKLFTAAWKVAPHLPEPLVNAITNLSADVVWKLNVGSVRQMRKNYRQFLGAEPSEQFVREAVRSYFRNFGQQFTLPGWSRKQIDGGLKYPGAHKVQELMKDGPVVLALTHSGNWDLSGAWFCQNFGPILTVAEKLDPAELFESFVKFRESLGMEIIGVGPGEHVFGTLVEKARGRSVLVPLLADRDISGSGIEVQLGEANALVAAGPAALAKALDCPLIAGHISYKNEGGKWVAHAHFSDPIPQPTPAAGESVVEAWTKAWVATVTPAMREHLVDWHMMQKVFVDDLDPQRLARARNRAAKGAGTEGPEAAEGAGVPEGKS